MEIKGYDTWKLASPPWGKEAPPLAPYDYFDELMRMMKKKAITFVDITENDKVADAVWQELEEAGLHWLARHMPKTMEAILTEFEDAIQEHHAENYEEPTPDHDD